MSHAGIYQHMHATWFAAKCENIFQDAIIGVILIKIDLHLLKVALIFCLKYWNRNVLIGL